MMIKNRLLLGIAIFLLLNAVALNLLFTHFNLFKDSRGSVLSVPFWTNSGYFQEGIALVFLIIVGLIILAKSLMKNRFFFLLITLILIIILPPLAKMYI
jgi:hypothetical protein